MIARQGFQARCGLAAGSSCRTRQSSPAAQATAPQAILFRVLNIADCAYVLDQGGVVCHAAARELLADNDIKERYCSV
jgi:hypothetical protein